MKNLIIASAVSLFLLAGCASLQENEGSTRLAVKYTTLKMVEEDRLTKEGIQETVDHVRTLIESDGEVDTVSLRSAVLSYVDVQSMEPSKQLLIISLLDRIEAQIEELSIEGEKIESVSVLLDWIDETLVYM